VGKGVPPCHPTGSSELPGEEGKSGRRRSASRLGKSLSTEEALGRVPLTGLAGARTGERLGRSKDGAESSNW